MKNLRLEIFLILSLLMVAPGIICRVSAQLLHDDGQNRLFQVNQPVVMELDIASNTHFRGEIDFPVSLVRLNGSDSQQISLNGSIGESFVENVVEAFRQLKSADVAALKRDLQPWLKNLEDSVLPKNWLVALLTAYAAFLSLLYYFFQARIISAGEVLVARPFQTVFNGMFASGLLLASIGLSAWSVIGILPAVFLLLLALCIAFVAPAIAAGMFARIIGGKTAGFKMWLLFIVLLIIACVLLTMRLSGLLMLVVSFILALGTIRCKNREENDVKQEVIDEKSC